MAEIRGKVVAITGAARGIGLATAKALAREGARVGMSDIDEHALAAAAEEVEGEPLTCRADVTDTASLRAFVDQVEGKLGPIDVMINNAGIMPVGPLVDEPDYVARKTIEINVIGVITGTKRALETMLPRGCGHVITIASMAGETVMPGLATYNASKFGALGFTMATRAEVKARGVEVTAILPAFVNTDLTSGTAGMKGVSNIEADEVAAAIVDVLKKPRPKVYVPQSAGLIARTTRLLPEPVQERIAKAFGADTVFLDEVDEAARRDYDERIGKE